MDDVQPRDGVFRPHPDRAAIVAEMHTRPAPHLQAPAQVSHVAMLSGRGGDAVERQLLAELCASYGALPPGETALHHVAQIGQLELRWERHTEFSTLMVVREGPFAQPFVDPPIRVLPEQWLARLPGQLVEASHLAVLGADVPTPTRDQLVQMFEGHHLMGGRVLGEQVRIWTGLRLHGDGFGRILIADAGYDATRMGRFVQRALELETYRLMALLGLTAARRLVSTIDDMESGMLDLTVRTAAGGGHDEEREVLDQLSQLAVLQARHLADNAYRFGATHAYAELVNDRLRRLKLERDHETEPLGSFLERRFEPAMRTCQAVEARMETLGQRINAASDMLRTRVDMAVQEQNQKLLTSMDRRARLQLRLQQTVEGLSVAAISYYVLGLLSYLLKGFSGVLGTTTVNVVLGLAAPLVLISIFLGVRRLRSRLGH
ncbi:MAG: DUF3422 domain-containing protein [Pseudomonadota bacterium]